MCMYSSFLFRLIGPSVLIGEGSYNPTDILPKRVEHSKCSFVRSVDKQSEKQIISLNTYSVEPLRSDKHS